MGNSIAAKKRPWIQHARPASVGEHPICDYRVIVVLGLPDPETVYNHTIIGVFLFSEYS